ncbi:MAG TPA: sulfite exporter TauE/SafE family protein [Pseudolabrys sp.]
MDSLPIVSATAGAFLLAGFVKGVIGLGLPTVAIGLLGLLMTPAQAAAILVVPSLVTNIWQFAVGGDLLALVRRMWPMLIGICVGTLIGATLLPRDNNGQSTVWLGIALTLYAGLGLIRIQFSVPPRAEIWLGLLMGTATGAITVATGIFVLPGTPYVQALQFERDRMVQALGLSFTVSTVTACRRADLCRRNPCDAGRSVAGGARRRADRHVARAIGARQGASRDVSPVLFPGPAAARRASGAARLDMID